MAQDYLPTEVGLTPGSEGDQVDKLQAYLARFGYLQRPPEEAGGYAALAAGSRAPKARSGTFDDSTQVGLRRFQQFFGLPVTGVLDEATLAQISRPRCGFPDLPRGGVDTDGGLARFAAQGSRWTRNNLTYGFQNFTSDLTQAQIRNTIVNALNLWSQATPLTFTEATNPDIVIRFVTGDHGDGNPFDGASGVLAHAYYPPPGGGSFAGDTHFDDAETWTVNIPVPVGGTDLLTVAAHEFGHALGLAHSTDSGALMYPYYGGPHRYLGADDALGIQTIYGARVRAVPGWFGWEDQGADIALFDINANGRPDLVVFHVDNPGGDNHGYYRIGWNLDVNGNVTGGWSTIKSVPGWFGWENQGSGIALFDINGNGRRDLIVFHLDNPEGDNHGYYRIGWNLDANGNVSGGWGPVTAVPGWFGWENQGAGIAVADINRTGRQDLVAFHVDNPGGDNHGYYRVITDL
jgi:hypothetical protein